MGPDSNSGPMVAYIDGKPIEMAHKPVQFTVAHYEDGEIVLDKPEITPDYSAGGVTAEAAAQAAERLAEAMGGIGMTMEVAAEGLERFIYSLEFGLAINLALALKPELVRRYRRTKKKRTRKKYEKRIMALFWEVPL